MTSTDMDDHESFENAFHYFVQALDALSSDAAKQCSDMDNFNVPWELQRDAAGGGLGVLRLSAHYLSWSQAEGILDVVAALRRLPTEALYVSHLKMTGDVGCLTAMNHPAWGPLRISATQLLKLLAPAIERNEAYFRTNNE